MCPAFNRLPFTPSAAVSAKCPTFNRLFLRFFAHALSNRPRTYTRRMATTAPQRAAEHPFEGSSAATLRKPHEMIVMVPRAGRVTITGRRLYNVLLQVSQSKLVVAGEMPPADFLFEAPLAALLKSTGSNGDDRTAAKRYLSEMQDVKVDWQSTAPGDGTKWKSLNMLSQAEIELRHGENWCRWAFPPDIMGALFSPERWARIDLDVLKNLSSVPSLALYEICARYRDSPGGLTSRQTPAWWLDALSSGPAGSEKREWRKFKNERVKDAVTEINTGTDLEIELIEHKEGRAVKEVQFAVRRKQRVQRQAVDAAPVDAGFVLRAATLGVPEAKLDALIREFGLEIVEAKVDLLEKRLMNRTLTKLENPLSYLRALLRNAEPVEVAPQLHRPVQATLSLAPKAEVTAPAAAGGSWKEMRYAALSAELAAMSAEQRAPLVDLARTEMIARGLWTAVTSRRAGQGDVLHGPFGAVLRKVYGVTQYGADWDREPTADAAL
jgi:hypothetical protein